MDVVEPYLLFTRKLQELGLRSMVSGSVAAIFYGEPRLTNDVDIIVVLHREDVERLQANFPDSEFYCPRKRSFSRNWRGPSAVTSTSSTIRLASKQTSI
ncbi:MAG: hypothetical protein RLZZ399_398 [Verrucomicrobiota bacterium]